MPRHDCLIYRCGISPQPAEANLISEFDRVRVPDYFEMHILILGTGSFEYVVHAVTNDYTAWLACRVVGDTGATVGID